GLPQREGQRPGAQSEAGRRTSAAPQGGEGIELSREEATTAESTLARALKVRHRLARRLAKAQADIQAYNSVPEGQADPVNVRAPMQPREERVGALVFLRRTTAGGEVELLGRCFAVDPSWPHRLVRAEVDLDGGHIRFYALRRRAPSQQPLVREVEYQLPHR